MFKFLKDKLKNAVSKISKKAEKEIEEPVKVEEKVEEVKPEPVKEKPKKEKKKKEEKKEEIVEEEVKEEPVVEEVVEEVKEKKGFFKKLKEVVTTKTISEEKFDALFWDLEVALLENNVAVEVIEKIKNDLKENLVNAQLKRGKIEETIINSLRDSLNFILEVPKLDLISSIKETKKEGRPYVILVLGYNGSGKSITSAKLAKYLKDNKLKPILGAGDTYRAAGAIQLGEYGKLVDVPVIKQERGADSCAVIYDTVSSGKAKDYDVVIADTAGRIHANVDLMEELKKIVRVNKPDLKVLVIDALTGTDVVSQAEQFDEVVGVDALILTKVDTYEKGGSILSAAYVLKKPILFLGCGQKMDSLKDYDVKEILNSLGF